MMIGSLANIKQEYLRNVRSIFVLTFCHIYLDVFYINLIYYEPDDNVSNITI